MKGVLRKPTPDDIEFISKNARQADIDEVKAGSGRTIKEAIMLANDVWNDSVVWAVKNKPVCIMGVNEDNEGNGIVWFIATDEFEKNRFYFARHCKKCAEALMSKYKLLYNYVHADHQKAIRWLKWLGFEFSEPLTLGVNKETFYRFEIKNV